MSEYVPSNWQEHAERGDWLEAAKLALLDPGASSGAALTCATIALTEAMLATRTDKPKIRTPDGIPYGWHVYIDDDGVPVLGRNETAGDA